jgi:phosphoribosylformimino-5-aminoimidazole carboxamide ribotide isomerase
MVEMAASTFDVIPAIDLRGGRVVRLRQGDFDRQTTYEVDPLEAATAFVGAGARWLHVVDLDAASDGGTGNMEGLRGIVDTVGESVRIELSGGLRNAETVDKAIQRGVARVVVGTLAVEDPAVVGRLIGAYGPDRVAVALDVRSGLAVGHGWRDGTPGVEVTEALTRLADQGVETFEVTSIERDGSLEGPDLVLLRELVGLGRGAIVASAGISSLADLHVVRDVGCVGAIVGRALYENRISLAEAIAAFRPD